jgi:hypothetical protein
MNIFETKSKYFENNNQWFATKFSSAAITTVIILVAIVVLYMIVNKCVYNSYKATFIRDTKTYLTDYGFTFRDIQFKGVYSEDAESDNCTKRYLFKAKQLYHPNLNNGKNINVDETKGSLKLHIYAGTYAGTKLKVENIGMVWDVMELAPGDTSYFFVTDSISNWFQYLNDPKNELVRTKRLSKYPLSETIERLKAEQKAEGVDTFSINDVGMYKTDQEPVDTTPTSEAIDDFLNEINTTTSMVKENNYIIPSAVVEKKELNI